jgi:hypothetical protein
MPSAVRNLADVDCCGAADKEFEVGRDACVCTGVPGPAEEPPGEPNILVGPADERLGKPPFEEGREGVAGVGLDPLPESPTVVVT